MISVVDWRHVSAICSYSIIRKSFAKRWFILLWCDIIDIIERWRVVMKRRDRVFYLVYLGNFSERNSMLSKKKNGLSKWRCLISLKVIICRLDYIRVKSLYPKVLSLSWWIFHQNRINSFWKERTNVQAVLPKDLYQNQYWCKSFVLPQRQNCFFKLKIDIGECIFISLSVYYVTISILQCESQLYTLTLHAGVYIKREK